MDCVLGLLEVRVRGEIAVMLFYVRELTNERVQAQCYLQSREEGQKSEER